ncbi:adenine deaminase C-terminal domain-containing protein [Desulfosporosinus sp. FKA]|uniref:adenine deaminase C-terminal domain-containing protein n=1 Tax=Desulfosporosinus sp. FKA TaxID=1969834 RepID=UPI000B49DC25|nr:adenine deaminase C-terminal domain-containing protein [Desulfosporosinus sp. FKA]
MDADLIIKNVHVYNAYFKKFFYQDVAVFEGRVLHISEAGGMQLNAKNVIDGNEMYLIPGLIDMHMHIESSMTTPIQFAKAVITHGVTTVLADPHEIANVFGLEGIEVMMDMNYNELIDIFYGIPSSVPSTSFEMETSGGNIGVQEVEQLLQRKDVLCLGEVMNFRNLVENRDSEINKIISIIKEKRPELVIEGHCPKISGLELSKYIFCGVDGDHTQQTVQSLEEKIQKGMFVELQEKSLTQPIIDYVIEHDLYDHVALVTDDVMADKLVEGHLNLLVKKSIKMGMRPEMAIYISTYTPARRLKLTDRGSIAPGKVADFILLSDLDEFIIHSVFKRGVKVGNETCEFAEQKRCFPAHFYNSIKLSRLSSSDFRVYISDNRTRALCRIIKVHNDSTFTEECFDWFEVDRNHLLWQNSSYCLIAVFERYGKNNQRSYGLVGGDVLKRGAAASSYSHDSHNLMIMGRNEDDMVLAANWVIDHQGGICVADQGEIIAALELPVGGILSEESLEILAQTLKDVRQALKKLGYTHHNEIMSLSTLTLPVSPALKISDQGLIKVSEQKFVDLLL